MRYNLQMRIGELGGFGCVYKCADENGYEFACKVLEKDTDMAIKRFEREVRLLNRLNHPNIIKTITYNLSGEQKFYIMPLYKSSLYRVIPQIEGNMYAQHSVINAILNGIEYLHSEGVIHRDLKPANILYNNDNDIVITDFGLGIQQDSESSTLTQTAYGTRRYCPPEQWENMHLVDERADIYAIGKIIEDIVTNFETKTIENPTMKYIIDKCTKMDKNERFNSIEELRSIVNSYYYMLFGEQQNPPFLEEHLLELATKELNQSEIIDIANEVSNASDAEKIEIFFKNISTQNYKFLEQDSLVLTKGLVVQLCEYWNQSGWPFSYIDTIADLVRKIYGMSDDAGIKSLVLYEIMDLSILYNRWYAMDIVKELFVDVFENIPVQAELATRLRRNKLEVFRIFGSEDELPRMIRSVYQ